MSNIRVEEKIKAEIKILRGNEWEINNELVLREEKIYICHDLYLMFYKCSSYVEYVLEFISFMTHI